ncbi:potassium channel family protein [Metabacillus sp. RGM 3146]|uniref:potassium channel family protein n=1 Tax=Metabacillus sp. RGM 3146 TaxID=3401092 RepID=UPI003B9D954F
MKPNKLFYMWLKLPIFIRIAFLVVFIILLFGYLITIAEPEKFPSLFDGIWWAVVTISTVGFGDLVPVTVAGRIVGIILILLGAGFLTAYFANLSAAAIQRQHLYTRGQLSCKSEGHLIVIGWNAKAREMINTMKKMKPDKKVVLIDQSLFEAPLQENIHFIKGNPAEDAVLIKANIDRAEGVIITADQHKTETDSDMQSVLILLAVKGLNPDLYTIVEILNEQYINNAKRAGADEIIRTFEVTSHLMMNSLFSKEGLADIFEKLNPATGNHIEIISSKEISGWTFMEASAHFLRQEKILLGVKKGNESILNPSPDYRFIENEKLILFVH